LTLSEFDRMCRGYHRRQTEAWRRTRWLGTILLNVNRAHDTPAYTPEEVLGLPGDLPPVPPMSVDELEETMARLAEFDALFSAA
jgi:hypothetical protein